MTTCHSCGGLPRGESTLQVIRLTALQVIRLTEFPIEPSVKYANKNGTNTFCSFNKPKLAHATI